MAKRRKNRTHLKGGVASAGAATIDPSVPKSFVIRHGQVGRSLSQLVRDVRQMMEPHTASRLKERARNKLRDFLTLAPALGVSHLMSISMAPVAPMLRLVRLPSGPSLTFRIERYALCKDVRAGSKHARAIGLEYLSPPLLVLASFPAAGPGVPPHIPLLMKSFQSLFPPLSPQTLALSSARRIVLVAYSPEKGSIEIRHYAITVRPAGVSKRVRRVLEGPSANAVKAKTAREGKDGKDGKEKVGREGSAAPSVASTSAGTNASMPHAGTRGVLDLGREKDVADYVLRLSGIGPADGYESAASDASSAAGDDGAAVDLASDYVGRGNKKGARRAVRLDEIGPRMDIRLVKIAEGVPGKEGEVIYHEFVKKSKKEVAKQRAEHAEREKIRKQRREEQEKNVERKKAEATSTKDKGKSVAFADGEGDEEDGDDVGENEDEDEDMDGEQALSEDDGDGDEGWDEDADADEGGNDSGSDEDSDDEDEAPPPPRKKKK